MKKTYYSLALIGALLLGGRLAAGGAAEIEPHPLFSDNMVIQRRQPIRVWGRAVPGGTVRVTLNGKSGSATVAANGEWNVELPPEETAGGPYELLVEGEKSIRYQNVMIGDVWVCSGQSNMEWPVRSAKNAKEEIAAADHPELRLFSVPDRVRFERTGTLSGEGWKICRSDTVGEFSAVGYFFGRELSRELNIPIGLIDVSWGGSPAEAWIPLEAIETDPTLRPLVDRFRRNRAKMTPEAVEAYENALKQWRELKKTDSKAPCPEAPWGREQCLAGGLFNGMICPLLKFGIKGVAWYQGEANVTRARQYRPLLKLLIGTWRKEWNRGDFPFLIVQLANFQGGRRPLLENSWAELREAQQMALELPNTALTVTCDIGEPRNIHPANKQEVGRRLALAAEKVAYGMDVVCSGPEYRSMTVDGNRAVISFRHIGGGLVAKGGSLKWFQIAGEDRKFYDADAEITGDKVVVGSPRVPVPVAVRYAWRNNPENCNFYNREGLPAVPFRTDSWPGTTDNNH